MNERIRVNYVNEAYVKCLANKINNNTHSQSNMPKIKLVNKLLAKKKQLFAKLIQSKRFNLENSNSDETDSNYEYVQKRKRNDDLDIELPTSKRIDIKSELEAYGSVNDIEMNEKHLWLIADSYPNLNEWKEVSLELGLESSDIQIIQARYMLSDGLKECFYQCLLKWRLKKPEYCYLNYFLNIIKFKFNESNEQISKLKEIILTSSSSSMSQSAAMLKFYLKNLEQKKKSKLNESTLKMKLEESHLWSASGLIFQEWKAISRNLSLNELDLVSIETKHMQFDGIRECCYQSLLKWSQYFYEHSSLEDLCLCLIQMKFNLYAKQLVEEFCF